jgi:dihydroflavonol-4-reductase
MPKSSSKPGLVLVTGGSGYVAGYCIAQLLIDGWSVRATVRSVAKSKAVRATIGGIGAKATEIEFVEADLNSDAGWDQAATGAQYVLHVASPVPVTDPKNDDELVRPARDGTLRVLKAARDAGAKRIVMTSSISAIIYGRGVREKPFTEEDWTDDTNRSDTSPMIGPTPSPRGRPGHGCRQKARASNSSPSTPA